MVTKLIYPTTEGKHLSFHMYHDISFNFVFSELMSSMYSSLNTPVYRLGRNTRSVLTDESLSVNMIVAPYFV